jgi:hypothetical protein
MFVRRRNDTMRDDFLRRRCASPASYDKVIDLIKEKNPAAQKDGDPEEWASYVVNNCISHVLFGDAGTFASTGMAMAVRVRGKTKDLDRVEVVFCP